MTTTKVSVSVYENFGTLRNAVKGRNGQKWENCFIIILEIRNLHLIQLHTEE